MGDKVLVLQENIVMNRILERHLQSKGFQCIALNSLDAVKAINFHPKYDLVVTDILFHGIHSLDFIREITSLVQYQRFIVVTALGQEKVKRQIMKFNKIDQYLDYPVDLELI